MYRVYVTFNTGDQHLDTDWCGQEQLLQSLKRLCHGPVAHMGIIKEIRVVDQDDYIIFLSQSGKQGFPPIPQSENNHVVQN